MIAVISLLLVLTISVIVIVSRASGDRASKLRFRSMSEYGRYVKSHRGPAAGYVGDDLLAGPIQQLYNWNDANRPAAELQARIAKVDLVGTIATVRLELDNWTGSRYTDFFTLLNVDGEWKIINKVFHLHS